MMDGQEEPTSPAPVILLHGMCCTGEVWRDFQQVFTQRGHAVYTPTLQPHVRKGGRRPPKGVNRVRLSDYVEQVHREVDRVRQDTGRAPVLVGHSMGGLIAQLVAQRNRIAAAVFISPSSPVGARLWSQRFVFFLIRFSLALPIFPGYRGTKRFVMNLLGNDEARQAHGQMVWESGRAFRDMATARVDERKIRIPVLTVAAGADRLVPPAGVRLVGKKYEPVGGEFIEYAQHAHWLYAEPGWEQAASEIQGWLHSKTVVADPL